MRQLLFPRRCPCCRRVLGTLPLCEVCTPRLEELRRGPVMRLDASRHYLGALDGAAAPYRYEGVVRSAILRAKYEGESWTAVELGVEMTARLFGAEVEMHFAEPVPGLVSGAAIGYDCIVPVPATSRRRGYNVPERMAQPLAHALGLPLLPKALCRVRAGRHQAGLSLDERLENAAGAFRAQEPELVEGKRVLLVDMGLETVDKGEFEVGETVKVAYVDQQHRDIDPNKSVYQVISGGNELIRMGGRDINARAYLSRFNFSGGDQEKLCGVLSGGERNRLHLAMALKEEGNVLLLDEPTNDIDVNTLRALEEGLEDFAGCAVVISHDRWFLDRICTHILAFEGDSNVFYFEGSYSEYEENKMKRLGNEEPKRVRYRKLMTD